MADTLTLPSTTVTGQAPSNDSDLLYALQLAHNAGDTKAAIAIAAQLAGQQVTHEPLPGNTSGSAHAEPSTARSLLNAYGNAVAGPVETAAQVGTGAIAQPIAGLAGLGAAGLHALGTNVDPAGVVGSVQNALTYSPRTQGGKATSQALGQVAGVIPEVANAAGEKVSDVTGSPALGALANTGVQGMGMILGGEAPAIAGATRAGLASIPGVTRAGQFASDILPGGANRAARRIVQQYAGGPDAAAQAAATIKAHVVAQNALDQAGQSGSLAAKYGIQPTTAQIANNPGLAQLDRSLRNQGDDVTAPLAARDTQNQASIHDMLSGISGSPEERLRAATARDYQARTMYDDALNNPEHFVQPPKPADASFGEAMDRQQGAKAAGDNAPAKPVSGTVTGLSDVGTRLQELLQRPAMQDAMTNASRVAANFGKKLDDRNLIQQMHYAKMHLDDQIGAAQAAGKTNDYRSLLDTKHELLGVMDDLSPAYAQARENFIGASRPVNRMELGEALRQKYMSALADAGGTGTRPSSFAEALRKDNGDQIARTATGFGGATMENTLHPADIAALNAARDQMARQQYAQSAGRSVGSNTGQNIVNQRALDNIGGIKDLTGELGNVALAVHNPLIALPMGLRGASVRNAAKVRLGNMMVDPATAAEFLKRAPSTAPIPSEVSLPAAVGANANAQDHAAGGKIQKTMDEWKAGNLHSGSKQGPVVTDQKQAIAIALNQERKARGHADGGEVKKSTFWDLVQQAIKELAPGDTSPQGAPLGTGAASQAAQQIEANPQRIMNQADAQS